MKKNHYTPETQSWDAAVKLCLIFVFGGVVSWGGRETTRGLKHLSWILSIIKCDY